MRVRRHSEMAVATRLSSANEDVYRTFTQSVEDMGALRMHEQDLARNVWSAQERAGHGQADRQRPHTWWLLTGAWTARIRQARATRWHSPPPGG